MTAKKVGKKEKEGTITKTTAAKAAVKKTEDLQGPLTEDAWAHYTKPLDQTGISRRGEKTGTTLMGFLPLRDVRRLANLNAGGLGQVLEPIDFIFIYLVEEASMTVEEIFVDGFQAIIRAKKERDWLLSFHEEFCFRLLMAEKREKALDIFNDLNVTKESVGLRKLVEKLTKDELDSFVRIDGEKERCCLYDEGDARNTCSEFQPVLANKVRNDLARLVDGGLDISIEDAMVTDSRTGKKVEIGSFVVGPEPPDSDAVDQIDSDNPNEEQVVVETDRVVMLIAHGHPTWNESDPITREASRGFKGPSWLLEKNVVQNRKGHLSSIRADAHFGRTGLNGLGYCSSRAVAETQLAETNGHDDRMSRTKAKRKGLFGKKKSHHRKSLLGGIGEV